jgi:hypothetical protein
MYGKLPLSFEANVGQSDKQVRFLSRGLGYTLFLTDDAAVLNLRARTKTPAIGRRDPESGSLAGVAEARNSLLSMKLVGVNHAATVTGSDLLPDKSNYFVGNDPKKWRTNVSQYAKVKYESVYPGIDLVYYGNQRQLEYDFVVAPGSDPGRIRFQVQGAGRVRRNKDGELSFEMRGGEVRWQKPVVYQERDGRRELIEGQYVVHRGNRVGFEVGNYDLSRALIIDPVLLYSTYLGGSGFDSGEAIALDSSGNAYIAGVTESTNFPTIASFQSSCNSTCGDAFVTKLNSAGSLEYSTFLGGGSGGGATGIAVDAAGNAYVTGWTLSSDFPVLNSFQSTCGGGCANSDAFVSVLNPSGSGLVYSTFLGGSGADLAQGIAVDSLGNAYITGSTASTDFPVSAPLQSSCLNCTAPDYFRHAFVTELAPSGSQVVYSTYLGGSGDDRGNGIAVDTSGGAYVTGSTSSQDFPTINAVRATCSTCNPGTLYTAFVTKVAPSGSALSFSTFLGGSSGDQGNSIAVDVSGSAYVTGYTYSNDFPTINPVQTKPTGGVIGQDAFVAKFSTSGSSLVYSTYLGGIEPDAGQSIAVDSSGSAYVTGWTQSSDFPTINYVQNAYSGGTYDAFVTEINPIGSAFVYSTYLGGSESDQGFGIAVDSGGSAYVTGTTTSTGFPTLNPVQPGNAGNGDAFVSRISSGAVASTVILIPSVNPASLNQNVVLNATVVGQSGGTPTGTVTFMKDTTVLGTATLSGGQATLTKTFSGSGTKCVSAVYSGDGTFLPSTSPVLYEGVGGYASTTAVAAATSPSVLGQSVILTSTVSSSFGTPTGTVSFLNGSSTMGTATLTNGVASFTKAFNSVGTHTITAVYSGDASFAASTSPAMNQLVMVTLTLDLTGSGAGSVSSTDGLISGCTSAGGSNCTAIYPSGSSITLDPTSTGGSSFSWSAVAGGTPICSGSVSCNFVITANTTLVASFNTPGIQASPTFSIDYNSSSQFPAGIRHGQGRLWDTSHVEWIYVQTSACTTSPCPGSFVWDSLDFLLGQMAQNSVYTAQYSLARTPGFLSSNPADTTCHYQNLGGPGQCDAPNDLNADGTGTDLNWRNWVAAVSAHVNAPGYTASHAHVQYWEIWNEPDSVGFWGGSSPATQGTFDQLVRMEEDAYCIVKGGTFTNDYTGESCAAVLATVTSVSLAAPTDPTASIVMPSYHGGSASLELAACFLYGTGASGGACKGKSLHYGGAGAAHTDALNFHMKPQADLGPQMDSWVAAIDAILSPAELAKPLYNTEGGYSGQGWAAPYNTADMEEAYIGQFYVYSIYKGIGNTVWYNDQPVSGGLGVAAPPNDANTAYSNVFNWMVGASTPACTLNSDGIHTPNSLYVCTTTLANGVAAQIMWDVDPSMYCSGTTCPTINQPVSSSYLSFLDLAGNKTAIVGNAAPVGIKPVLVEAQ